MPASGQPIKSTSLFGDRDATFTSTTKRLDDGSYEHHIIVRSRQPTTIQQCMIQKGDYNGRAAFALDPSPLPHQIFPIFDLPSEIRLMIYGYCLGDWFHNPNVRELAIWSRRITKKRPSCGIYCEPSMSVYHQLILLGRQVHRELVEVLFSRLDIFLDDTTAANRFLPMIGKNIQLIRKINIPESGHVVGKTAVMKLLLQASRLETFWIDYIEIWELEKVAEPWLAKYGKNRAGRLFFLDLVASTEKSGRFCRGDCKHACTLSERCLRRLETEFVKRHTYFETTWRASQRVDDEEKE